MQTFLEISSFIFFKGCLPPRFLHKPEPNPLAMLSSLCKVPKYANKDEQETETRILNKTSNCKRFKSMPNDNPYVSVDFARQLSDPDNASPKQDEYDKGIAGF